jgi:formylglycine-generating enzyme required for sulfatase activity
LFLLTLFTPSGQAQADVFFLQGQDGQDGQDGHCDCNVSSIDGDLTVTGNISVGGNADVAGDTSLGGSAQVGQDLEVAGRLSVTGSYELPDCPSGYEVDPSADPSILVCVDPVNGDEMVHVGDFWIDRYEVTVFDAPTCAGAPLGDVEGDWPAGFPENGNWETKLYACSVSGGNPSRFLTWYSAQQACAAMGKQLCTNSEWQAAAAGTHDPGDHDGTWGGACHTAGLAARQTGNAGNAPGETGSCISVWGMEDAIGNVWEWVADWHAHPGFNGETNTRVFQYAEDGYWAGGPIYSAMPSRGVSGSWRGTSPAFDADGVTLGYFYGPAAARRGGSWGSSTRAGVFALAVSSGPSHTYEYQGARCCRRR